jgi:hypothetical protein
MPRLALDDLHYEVECRKVLVVGSARLERPLDREPDELVVCVNGGISTFPGVADFWVVNSRANARFFTNERLRMHKLMMDQCSRRFIETVVFVTRAEGSEQVTALWMEERGCGWRRSMLLDPGARAMVERDSGGRIKGMERQTASLGLTTVALFLWAGALRVRLRGFSRTAGYEYLPKDAPVDQRWRAHLSADIGMMEHLLKRHGERVQGYGMREA